MSLNWILILIIRLSGLKKSLLFRLSIPENVGNEQ